MDREPTRYDTLSIGFETPEFSEADALADDLADTGPSREEPQFGLTTGAFRNERSGRFVDGRPPESYDGTADRFREPTGEFERTPDPVPRDRFPYTRDLTSLFK